VHDLPERTRAVVTPLCQRGEASCGACCGLYNREDFSREAVGVRLRRRTEVLRGTPRTPEAFAAAGKRLAAEESPAMFPTVRVCPLLGYLDEAETRIGCLAHPLSTGGPDLRDCGVYDAKICDGFFCPSHAWLTEDEAALAVALCAGDPWLYGLVVTDVPFLRAALGAVADRVGARVMQRHLAEPAFHAALKALLALKEELEPGSAGLFGAFEPGADGEPIPRRIDYEAIGRELSPYDAILLCVGADPASGNDLDRLEGEVRRRVERCVEAFPG
jgi:hypothetical protein